ncbi:hypothetical protein [Luteolibacter sp. AS25]|uniref:hypothetical protein n=1 Tax=Luteolibacter sp. AS25 TaxID=3135776 RepID=UPI00398A878D
MCLNTILPFLLFITIAGAETVELESKAGSKTEVELIDRGPQSVRLKTGGKYVRVDYADLTAESVKTIKASNIPLITKLEIQVNVNLDREEVKQASTGKKGASGKAGKGGKGKSSKNNVKSTTIYTVSGSVTVSNKDNAAASPAGNIHVSILSSDPEHEVLSNETLSLQSLDPFGESSFDLATFTTKEAQDQPASTKGKTTAANQAATKTDAQGKTSGWVAAVVVEKQIVAFAASSTHLEPRSDRAIDLLKLNGKVDYENAVD